ncbi:hypothetical protein KAU33_15870 [Candidatus Dependentiae bacterium]|nr:hypothetical protein [Candidatus Dependentiae bacterium]
MPHHSHLTKISSYKDQDIESFNIYSSDKDNLFRMKVKCEFCHKTQCRCFGSIEEAISFEGYVCSSRCFVLTCRGDDETLDKIIEEMDLKVPLESLDVSVFDEIVSEMQDEIFDDYECPQANHVKYKSLGVQ